MRWKAEKLVSGDRRSFRKFLLFPRCIQGMWRWLEYATIVQELVVDHIEGDWWWTDLYWGD